MNNKQTQHIDDDTTPIVSISCITYNHAPYIRKCLEGFLMQKTTFPIEVLIHDDASTDGTEEIIREYEAKYPDIIKPLYETENQWVKGKRGSRVFNFPRARGKYIALCEGDDYWTDPLKLQKQVDFLEKNTDYVLTCHRYSKYDEDEKKWYSDNRESIFEHHKKGLTFRYPFKRWITKTLTVVFRKSALSNMSDYSGESRDFVLVYFLMKNGKGFCFNENMGVYRKHYGGVVSKQSKIKKNSDSYSILKDLYKSERNWLTRKMYYRQYYLVFFDTKGKILFQERFEPAKFLSIFYFLLKRKSI